jgi:hypothetical protein
VDCWARRCRSVDGAGIEAIARWPVQGRSLGVLPFGDRGAPLCVAARDRSGGVRTITGMRVWWRGRRERRRLLALARAVEVREWRAYQRWVSAEGRR